MKYQGKNVLVTGGAGFIGSNTSKFFLDQGANVTIYDSFIRDDVENNVRWLEQIAEGRLKVIKADIIDSNKVEAAVKGQDIIIHLAAQVAVTTSVEDPVMDFRVNIEGTINLLEAVRKLAPEAIIVYSSTNKVYGQLENLGLHEGETRYSYSDEHYLEGIDETQGLDFHSPYGCSKGSADQYIRDYARIYGLKTIVFRQSCIYGTRQFGSEDQGWIFHIMRMILEDKQVSIFGDGKQVRDVLYVDDLVNAYVSAIENIEVTSGQIYNVGGGLTNTLSIIESINTICKIANKEPNFKYEDWRKGDQRIFVSNNSKAKRDFDWEPRVSVEEGLEKLKVWIEEIKS